MTVPPELNDFGFKPTKAQSLEALINKILIVAEALKLRIEGESDDVLVREYINLKVRAFITIKEGDVLAHYKENQWKYKGASYDSIKGDIRKLLEEKAVNEKLKRQLKILRKGSSIRIMLEPSHGANGHPDIGRVDPYSILLKLLNSIQEIRLGINRFNKDTLL